MLSKEFSKRGANVITVDAVKTAEGEIISSSAIRTLIEDGDIEKANEMLSTKRKVGSSNALGRIFEKFFD